MSSKLMINFDFRLYVVVHYNTSSLEARTGGLPVGGQPGLHRETVSKQTNKKEKIIFIVFFVCLFI